MGLTYCCTIHGPWGRYGVVQSMHHGVCILSYNPWVMGYVYWPYWHMTHASWTWCTGVQPMGHGVGVLSYNPRVMGLALPIYVVQFMTHGEWISHHPCVVQHSTSHGSWVVQHVVRRRMAPWPMGFCHITWSVTHGKKVAEPCVHEGPVSPGEVHPYRTGITPQN